MRLYAIRVFVRNWPEACAFYRDTLGLEERFVSAELGWAEYDVGGSSLAVERVDPGDSDGTAMIGRMTGVSLRVDDIETVYRELLDRGVHFDGPPEKQPWGGTLANFSDLEGNVFTLLQ